MSDSASGSLRSAAFGEVSQALRVLEDLGVTPEDLKRLCRDRPFAERLVAVWKKCTECGDTVPDTGSQARARGIMGKNFLGLDEVYRGYEVAYTDQERLQLSDIPFSDDTLRAWKHTHVLVAGARLCVNEIRTLAHRDFRDTDWYLLESFCNQRVSVRWHLLRKEPVPASCNKTYDEQTALLTREEQVPFACEVAYMVILYWLTHRERLLPQFSVRCRDKVLDRYTVCIGHFDSDGLHVHFLWNAGRSDGVGLASSRVLNSAS